MTSRIKPTEIRFIKLGRRGTWEEGCIEGPEPCIRLGFNSGQHPESLAGNWKAVEAYWRDVAKKTPGIVTANVNQVKAFYTLPPTTLWITFFKRKLYWCFAEAEVRELPDGSRIRSVIGKWSSTDALGRELLVENLSGALAKVQGFRGTICTVKQASYLLRRLNGEVHPALAAAAKTLEQLEQAMVPLIRSLGWKDFELLADLVFTGAGWQRLGALGKTEKSIDLDLLSPVNGRRAYVQVKSEADLKTFLMHKRTFERMDHFDEMYFVVHSPTPDLTSHTATPPVTLLLEDRLAKLVVAAGLTRWVLQKLS